MHSLTPQTTARDLLVLLDVSQSMLAEDRPPNSRLRSAKDALQQLLDHWQRRGATTRLGLAIFAGRARLVCPPTEDREHLAKVLTELSPDSFGSLGRLTETDTVGTSFRRAVRLAEEWIAAAGPDAPFIDLLLISDGDDVAGDVPTAATAAREAKLTLHVLGVGDPTQDWPVPYGNSFLMTTDANGQSHRVLTRRRDEPLRILADSTTGKLIFEEADPRPLVSWWEGVERPGRPLHSAARLVPIDRSDYVLGGLLILMMLELALGGARRREW
jgi:Ca-activated chloride channel family protein